MEFTQFCKENEELLNHLENLGFELEMYDSDAFWHFNSNFGNSEDALKYYENEGVVLFSAPTEFKTPNEGKIININYANDMYFAFRKSLEK